MDSFSSEGGTDDNQCFLCVGGKDGNKTHKNKQHTRKGWEEGIKVSGKKESVDGETSVW